MHILKFVFVLTILFLGLLEARAMTGVNLGGWLVLEPWITPSLFYRFLNKPNITTAMDSYTFCETLGPVEGNKVMRAHWATWVTEDLIGNLSTRGVEMVRLPIGDWTLNPYGPYKGCMDGAADQIDWLYNTAAKYNITVWLDVHTAKGCQNGFDNGGQAKRITWLDDTHYQHDREPEWLTVFNRTSMQHSFVNFDNLAFSLKSTEDLLIRWGNHSAFAAFEPVNEPLDVTPLEPLFEFYREARKLTRRYAPQAKFVFHDSFRYEPEIWNKLFTPDDVQDTVLDHHFYWAFAHQQGDYLTSVGQTCAYVEKYAKMAEQFHYDVWFGEWALATDNCAQHLNGFNNGEMNPNYTCAQMECPKPYITECVGCEASTADLDRTSPILGPFGNLGTNQKNSIKYGKCWTDSLSYSQLQVQYIA